jgi:hypothetical protein
MKYLSLILFTSLWVSNSQAQTTTPVVLNSNGLTAVVNNVTFEFSLGEVATTTISNNHIITQGLLQPAGQSTNAPLPVTALQFHTKRINAQHVQLDWKTVQEVNNKGFYIERRKEPENKFTAIRFINSKAINGNSNLPLNYVQVDTNAYAGNTYYRLKQEDFDGKSAYSVIRVITGSDKTVTLKAWPIPAPVDFSVAVTGVQKDQLLIYDMSGKLVKQVTVTENEVTKITNLRAGTYIIKLKSEPGLLQKVIVQ